MCGIAGFVGDNNLSEKEFNYLNSELLKTISQRGPDNSGFYREEHFPILLVHSRLSIRDLSSNGNQPMFSNSGRYVLIFNGEIYNSDELKNSHYFKNYSFKGTSDTEILLGLIDIIGVDETLSLIDGMFAFALWDKVNCNIGLYRDSYGEKPLYWGKVKNEDYSGFLFSSDISSFTKIERNLVISAYSKKQFFEYGCILSPNTIFENIYQLEPGHKILIKVNQKNHSDDKKLISVPWRKSLYEFSNSDHKVYKSLKNKNNYLLSKLKDSIKSRVIADVPICTFLSSGIDSSLITSIASQTLKNTISTFTIKFDQNINYDKNYDESERARQIASYLNTNHTEFTISPDELIDAVEKMNNIFTEPFADSSQVPTYLLCKKVREKNFKVALTGDGGDELFAGYNRHIYIPKLYKKFSKIPPIALFVLRKSILSIKNVSSSFFQDKLQKLNIGIENSSNLLDFYKSLRSVSLKSCSEAELSPLAMEVFNDLSSDFSVLRKVLLADIVCYLPNDILTKVDRSSMNVGLECRAPFLSKDIFYASNLFNDNELISNGLGKLPLRKLLALYLPKKYVTNLKRGFSIPLADWLRGPLKNWAEEVFTNCGRHSLVDEKIIENLWENHINMSSDNSKRLWSILIWENWFIKFNKYIDL